MKCNFFTKKYFSIITLKVFMSSFTCGFSFNFRINLFSESRVQQKAEHRPVSSKSCHPLGRNSMPVNAPEVQRYRPSSLQTIKCTVIFISGNVPSHQNNIVVTFKSAFKFPLPLCGINVGKKIHGCKITLQKDGFHKIHKKDDFCLQI